MGKYLELFRGEVGDLTEKTKLENKPYVAYSTKEGRVVYTVVPAKDPVVGGPADNEIWYTSTDGEVIIPDLIGTNYNIISNTYENGKGVIVLDSNVPADFYGRGRWFGGHALNGEVIYNVSTRLKSIQLPNCVTNIDFMAFAYCSSLTSITIPNGVTNIGAYAFDGCNSLTSIIIPDSVTSIRNYAFVGCSSLTSVTIPNSVTSIDPVAFGSCTSLTSVNIPNSVTIIEYETFSGCKSLTSIVIPNSVTSIGWHAFEGCSSLTSITFKGTIEEWNNITKEDEWNLDTPATYVHCTDGDVIL